MRYRNACSCACLLLYLCLSCHLLNAQSVGDETPPITDKYLKTVDGKISRFDEQAETYSRHALDAMISTERRMQAKVAATDPAFSKKMFSYAIDSLQKLKSALSTTAAKAERLAKGKYFPYTDSLRQALAFLQKNSGIAGQASAMSGKLTASMQQLDVLEGKMNTIAAIQNFVQQRIQVLNSITAKFPQCMSNLQQLNKTAYYYSAQMAQYKAVLKDPSSIERQMLDKIGPTTNFQSLIQNNGQLAGLFAPRSAFSGLSLSGGGSNASGFPNRATLQEYIRKNNPAIGDTTDLLGQLQSKFTSAGKKLQESGPGSAAGGLALPGGLLPMSGGGGNTTTLPSFTPNNQKTKPFGKRLEWGADFQFGKAVSYLPSTANIGVTAGYRLNDRLSAGVGVDYLLGMGTGWKDIHFTNQGVGLRSYGKWQIKKGWNIQEGVEFNYMTAFNSISQLRGLQAWQTSALVGISKQYKVSKKVSGNFQVLYDFLYKQHLPNTQPILFRFGYNLK